MNETITPAPEEEDEEELVEEESTELLTVGIISNGTESVAPATFEFQTNLTGGTEPYTYVWNFGDGSEESNEQTVSHTVEEAGIYNVTLGVTDTDNQTASDSIEITVEIEAIGRDGYIICQAYIPAAKKGDIRLFLMNGRPLEIDGKYAALRRVAAKDDIRSNIHAGGTAEAVEIGKTELRVAEIIRPKLIADGMFLVGIDIVGDKILEVNVFSPGNLMSCSNLAGVDFSETVIDSIERKVEIAADYGKTFDNRHLAIL